MAKFLCVLYPVLLLLSCAPTPKTDGAVVTFSGKWQFPFVFLDFGSASVFLQELNGEKTAKFGWIEIPPGQHEMVIAVWKGPTGYLGTAPLLGQCRARIKIQIEPGSTWRIEYKRDKGNDFVQIWEGENLRGDFPCLP